MPFPEKYPTPKVTSRLLSSSALQVRAFFLEKAERWTEEILRVDDGLVLGLVRVWTEFS